MGDSKSSRLCSSEARSRRVHFIMLYRGNDRLCPETENSPIATLCSWLRLFLLLRSLFLQARPSCEGCSVQEDGCKVP